MEVQVAQIVQGLRLSPFVFGAHEAEKRQPEVLHRAVVVAQLEESDTKIILVPRDVPGVSEF